MRLLSFKNCLLLIRLRASMWPYVVPFEITFRRAAAAPESQSLLLVGTVIMLPVVVVYCTLVRWTNGHFGPGLFVPLGDFHILNNSNRGRC